MNKERFIEEVTKLGIELTEEQVKQLEIYCDLLLKQNEVVNLTAIKDKEGIYLKHFYDSLTVIKEIKDIEGKSLLDVGSGAGFPGMVLKIVFPNLEVHLLDSNNKKIDFLKKLAEKLNLTKIYFIHERVEDHFKEVGASYDYVVARAVANLSVLAELCMPLVKQNGYFIPMKGKIEEEIEDGTYAILVLGGKIENISTFTLPIENSTRNIIKIKKWKETPSQYPRRYDKIVKNPLKKR